MPQRYAQPTTGVFDFSFVFGSIKHYTSFLLLFGEVCWQIIKFLKNHKKVMTNEYADNEIKDFYENVVVRHGDIEDFFAENSDYNSKAAIVAYVIQNEASDDTPRRLVDGFTFDDDDKEDRPCVAASKRKIEAWQKEHPGNGFNLKVFSDTLKKYADELGLEFGDVYYYLVVEDDKADEMGVRV